jgi:hypothetical protein
MTAEMAFESLMVCRDAETFRVIDRLLSQYSISNNVCLHSEQALDELRKGSTDLLVIDFEGNDGESLLHNLWKLTKCKKPTILAITSSDQRVPLAHFQLKKPLTAHSGALAVKTVYSRMLTDFRLHARYALMLPVTVVDEHQRVLNITITDIGNGGVGISTRQELSIGTVLRFPLRLPTIHRDIQIEARVLWIRDYGRAGCEFVRIPPVEMMILRDWLKSQTRIKKPRVEL